MLIYDTNKIHSLAILELRLTLAHMIFNFDMKLAPGSDQWIERQLAHAIWLKPALPIYLTPRDVV